MYIHFLYLISILVNFNFKYFLVQKKKQRKKNSLSNTVRDVFGCILKINLSQQNLSPYRQSMINFKFVQVRIFCIQHKKICYISYVLHTGQYYPI